MPHTLLLLLWRASLHWIVMCTLAVCGSHEHLVGADAHEAMKVGHMSCSRCVPCVRLTRSGWVSAGYQRLDYAAGVLLKDNKTLTVAYAHNVDATLAAGAEITKQLEEKEGTSFTLG